MKHKIAMTFLVGAGIGLSGCQSPTLGGLSIFNKNGAAAGSTAPDVSSQKFSGLSQQLTGNEKAASAGLGGNRTPAASGLFASWTKSSAAGASAATIPKISPVENDPLRLDQMPKKISPEVYVGAARLLENQGKFAEAEEKYRDALKAAPNNLSTLVGLARLYDRQGQTSKAIEVYHKASQAHPTSGLVFNDLGLCFRRQRQLEKSLIAFHKAVELVPDNAKYRNNLAGALVEAGKNREAYEQLAATSSAAVAHFNLAYLLQQKGDRTEAIRNLQAAVALDAALTPARDMLAQLGGTAIAPPSPVETPAPRLAAQPAPEPTAVYAAGAVEQPLYTSAPQIEPPASAEAASYHIADEGKPVAASPIAAGPVAETAQRPVWSSAAWAIPATAAPSAKPLPPTE